MRLKILDSGSRGNCYIFTDKNSDQLLVECGVRYDTILENIVPTNVQGCIISHEHKDHSLSKEKLELVGIDVFDHSNMQSGKTFNIKKWIVLPIAVKHGDSPCFAFIIKNTDENKTIFFATDLERLPKIADNKSYDLMLLETNYSQESLWAQFSEIQSKYMFHNSLENVQIWLSQRLHKPKTLGLIHLSNNNLISPRMATTALNQYAETIFVATKGKEVCF